MAVTLVKQFVLVVAYPPFEGHDEIAHFGYIATLDNDHRLPTLADNLPPETGPYSRFTLDWPAVYTANHPPLYYLLAWPLYRLASRDVEARLYVLRKFSVPIFLLVIWLTYLMTVTLFPGERFVSIVAPALVAFQPQLSFEGAIVDNDILAMMVGAAILYLLAIMMRGGATRERSVLLGVVLGVGLLTKATLTAFVPIAVGVVIWCAVRDGGRSMTMRWCSTATVNTVLLIIPALVVSLPWFAFLYATYGDLTAFSALDLLQATWGAPTSGLLDLMVLPGFHRDRLQEAWGEFGWQLLPLGRTELWIVEAVTILAVAGLLIHTSRTWRQRRRHPGVPVDLAGIAMLSACCAVFYLSMVYFGTRVAFTQVRYVFPAAPAAAVLAALGFRELFGVQRQQIGTSCVVAGAMLFQMLTLTRLVLPHGSV